MKVAKSTNPMRDFVSDGCLTRYQGRTIDVAMNPVTKRVEIVYPEDEVPAGHTITMHWSNSLERYISIPED